MPAKKKKEQEDAPKKKALYTISLTPPQMDKLGLLLKHGMYIPYEVEHSLFAYKGDNVNIVAYKSGKVVIQGKKTEDFVTDRLEPEVTGEFLLGYDEVHHPEWFTPHAGLDESGKGDLFGPLVVATVIADGEAVREWISAGIRDSKAVTSDSKIIALDKVIRETKGVAIKTLFTTMEKYNHLHTRFGSNLNRLMAWMHATALREALSQKQVPWGLLDQFSKQPLVQRQVKDLPIDLQMRTKAESDPVVAAASIVARALYVRQMKKLSDEAGFKLERGAGERPRAQALEIARQHGREGLAKFAKMHFKTAHEVLAEAGK